MRGRKEESTHALPFAASASPPLSLDEPSALLLDLLDARWSWRRLVLAACVKSCCEADEGRGGFLGWRERLELGEDGGESRHLDRIA